LTNFFTVVQTIVQCYKRWTTTWVVTFSSAMAMPIRVRQQLLQQQRGREEAEEAVVLYMAHQLVQERRQRRRRTCWVRPWIERRRIFGQYETLFHELERESQGDFHAYLRMDRQTFAELLQRVEPRITKTERFVFLKIFLIILCINCILPPIL